MTQRLVSAGSTREVPPVFGSSAYEEAHSYKFPTMLFSPSTNSTGVLFWSEL